MLLKVKSSFVVRKIFMNIDIKRKIYSIIYNKKLQEKLNINLIDYRRLSGKYKIEENDKVKIYNSGNNKLIYEGHYLNGKKNGFGREYNEKGRLIYEGYFYDGKKYFSKIDKLN